MSLLRHHEENSLEISMFDPIEITSGFHNSEPRRFAGLRHSPLSPLLYSQLSSQHRPPLFHMMYLLYLSMNFSTVGH